MAVSVVLAGTSSLTLSASPYGILEPGSLGSPALHEVYAGQWGRGHHPIVGDSYGNREMTLSLLITGTSMDNWTQNYRALAQVLRGTRQYYETAGTRGTAATLTVQLNGASVATVFDVLSGSLPDMGVLVSSIGVTTTPYVRGIPLRLTCKPFGRPASTLTTSGVINDGTQSFTLASPAGDHEAPARLSFKNPVSAFGTFLAGRRTRAGSSNIPFPMKAQPGTYSGYTVYGTATGGGYIGIATATDAGATANVSAAYVYRTAVGGSTGLGILRWSIDANTTIWHGQWRAYVEAPYYAAGTVSAVYELYLSYDGTGGTVIRNPSVNTSTPTQYGNISAAAKQLIDMGILSIPFSPTPATTPAVSYELTLGMSLAPATGAGGTASALGGRRDLIAISGLYLFPIDEQVIDVTYGAPTPTSNSVIHFNGLSVRPEHYVVNASGESIYTPKTLYAEPIMPTVIPGIDNRWFVLHGNAVGGPVRGSISTASGIVEMEYFPLYEGFAT